MKQHIVMMDMTKAGSINGVTRCITTLSEGLGRNRSLQVIWIRFIHGIKHYQDKYVRHGLHIIQIPLPDDVSRFLANSKLRERYWTEVYHRLQPVFQGSPILHIHTLNLIEFALLVKMHTGSKIVSHIHCMPWKGLYNTNIELFNRLYNKYYIQKDYSHPELFIRQHHEFLVYTQSDFIICVTECAKEFIHNICPNHVSNISVVVNGIYDWHIKHHSKTGKATKLIFVGSGQRSKGLSFVLAAMQTSLMRTRSSLLIVGNYSKDIRNMIINQYPFLDIEFAGVVGKEHLKHLYANSDVGIIGSIQEQCSYVAIEMMMAGLPVITTDVDGLSELFEQGVNAIKIPVHFSPSNGLQPDIPSMADAIVELGGSMKLRCRLGKHGRLRYKKKHTVGGMLSALCEIYNIL